MATQLVAAQSGTITDAMISVAQTEHVDIERLRDEVAAGTVVIPANTIHLKSGLRPAGIGRLLTTKINANIGTSSESSSIQEEVEKMLVALEVGADAMMDLSTGGDLDQTRRDLIAQCPVPFGTVPIYEVIQGREVRDVTIDLIMKTLEKQAEQGVDFFTIHAGLLQEHLPLLESRIAGIVSRGGALLAKWMIDHDQQNPLYEAFDEICALMAQYDVCFSLGDGLRPGAIADATDEAQLAELKTLGELVLRAQEQGCQVMVEGPGHVPYDQIQHNMEIQTELCHGAPFYVLGPIVTDLAPGYDHITSAIGGTAAAYYGASFLCYVTPREHLGLPTADDVRAGVVASKIAAHAADVARGKPGAAERDRRLSVARANLDWETHLGSSLDPHTAQRMHREACEKGQSQGLGGADYCSMCGENWCSLRVNREIKEYVKQNKTTDTISTTK
ncbi:phosphomethylpyrimidine synthase ThiC [Planctomycetota bacterium]